MFRSLTFRSWLWTETSTALPHFVDNIGQKLFIQSREVCSTVIQSSRIRDLSWRDWQKVKVYLRLFLFIFDTGTLILKTASSSRWTFAWGPMEQRGETYQKRVMEEGFSLSEMMRQGARVCSPQEQEIQKQMERRQREVRLRKEEMLKQRSTVAYNQQLILFVVSDAFIKVL